jgi:GDSL-like Lipase/Acylhydrolase family
MSPPSRRWAIVGGLVSLLLALGCSSTASVTDSAPPPPDPNQERVVFVALGGNETLNRQLDDPLREAWTQRVFMNALPRSAIHVNFATRDATVREGVDQQLPSALELRPTLATLWFGSADASMSTSDNAFERDLTQLVAELQAVGTRVLLLSPVDAGRQGDRDYANSLQVVATTTNSELVAVPTDDLSSTTTQAAIAAAVEDSLGP